MITFFASIEYRSSQFGAPFKKCMGELSWRQAAESLVTFQNCQDGRNPAVACRHPLGCNWSVAGHSRRTKCQAGPENHPPSPRPRFAPETSASKMADTSHTRFPHQNTHSTGLPVEAFRYGYNFLAYGGTRESKDKRGYQGP